MHPTLFETHDPGAQKIMERFEGECQFLSGVRHPNIVQYLEMSRDPDSGLPVLLMELMDSSLTRFLDQSEELLPFHIQVNLCHDIALALAYLHSNGIIHRDLSSNNVLLIGPGNRAKVTDFGMSKVADANPRMTPMTMCPGTLAYMPPEALDDPPVYTKKLDCFSFGVLDIQILTRQFPEPSQRFKTMETTDPRFPTGQIKVPVPELERRQSHIDLVNQAHPLLPVALNCLKDRERERPSAQELCHRLAALKEAPEYGESEQQVHRATTDGENVQFREMQTESQERQRQLEGKDQIIATKERHLQEKDRTITTKERQLQEKDHIIATKERQLQEKDRTIATKERQLQEKDRTIAAKERQLHEKNRMIVTKERQLQEKDCTIATKERQLQEKDHTIATKERQLQDHEIASKERQVQDHTIATKEGQLQEKDCTIATKTQVRGQSARKGPLCLNWSKCGSAPRKMTRPSTVVGGNIAYFNPCGSNDVYSYNSEKQTWSSLPQCPYKDCSLAVVNGLLTAIGGWRRYSTNQLLSLTGEKKWVVKFPPMPTKRSATAVVCSRKNLVVAGGVYESGRNLTTVEVMDTETLQWFTASSLPFALFSASVTICRDSIYLLGYYTYNEPRSVLACSMVDLLQSCRSQSLGEWLKSWTVGETAQRAIWHPVANLPVRKSSCATLCGQLIAVGGCDDNFQILTTDIHQYNPTTNSWEVISHMPTARSSALVAVLPGNKLMVVGGNTDSRATTDKVEIAILQE